MPRKTFEDRVKTTYASMKQRAKKYGDTLAFAATDLLALIPGDRLCRWCSRKITPATLNFDHIQPASRGGAWTVENLAAICASCNRRKGALTAGEYLMLTQALADITAATGSDYAERNILKRLAAGGAFIYG